MQDEPAESSQDEIASDKTTRRQESLLSQVAEWLHQEKSKRATRMGRSHGLSNAGQPSATPSISIESAEEMTHRMRRASEASEGSLALEKLEQIIADYASAGKTKLTDAMHGQGRRRAKMASVFKSKRASVPATSDTEYHDGDVMVPSADVYLDNSKTMAYTGGAIEQDGSSETVSKRTAKDREHWITFKKEIVRLTHTLRLKGWRRVPIENGGEIDVERLSGALTNAVYVVSPPKVLPEAKNADGSVSLVPKRQPK